MAAIGEPARDGGGEHAGDTGEREQRDAALGEAERIGELQREADLTHFAYYVLAMLSEAPGRSLRMSLLAAKSSSSPSRLSHTVSRLEAKGFVQRRRADEDGRGQVAMLTDEGYAYVVKTAPGHVQEVRRIVFAGLSPEAVAELDRVCTRLLSTLDPDGSLISHPPDHRN